ncbi:putative ubiquitin-specific protease 1B [Spatholobus suberectus]|nr:putative ubiquitin-specific protease 1B [Spatholobus suberectus]
MRRKRKNPSSSARAGSILEATTSEAIEPSSSAIRASETRLPVPLDPSSSQQVKKTVDKKSLSMLNKLYYFCTRRPKAHEESSVLVSMFGVYLNRKDSYTMRPKGWVSNMVILTAGKIMMEEEKATNGAVTRHILIPQFMDKVICASNLSNEYGYNPWCIEDVSQFILPTKLGYDINQCKLIFAPTLFEEHWSCYVFEPKDKTLYVLDSMHDSLSTSKKNLDDATKRRFEELLVLMNPGLTKDNASITLVYADVPKQQNIHDCGIYVLKYMETWDGSIKWQDKTMPDYQYKEIVEFRQSLICGWVQHPKNEVREEILKAAGVWGKLC